MTEVDPDFDDGTMPDNVESLGEALEGHRIVSVERGAREGAWYAETGLVLTLDNGDEVMVLDTNDCCAFTSLTDYVLNLDKIDHVITKVTSDEDYSTWHILCDYGDILTLEVDWSPGNPFYYGYGFDIRVVSTKTEKEN